MSDELSPLLSCPSLPRILRQLDSADDVINCRRVCKSLNRVIESNPKFITKHLINVEITMENTDDYRSFQIMCSCLEEGTQKPLTLTIQSGCPLQYSEPLPTCFKAFQTIRDGEVVENLQERLRECLLLIMTKFDCLSFKSCRPVKFETEELEIVKGVIKKSGVRVVNCHIHPQEWKLPVMLNSEKVFVHRSGNEIVDESLLLIDTTRAIVNVGIRRWIGGSSAHGSMAIVRRFLQEWYQGERDIFDLTINILEFDVDTNQPIRKNEKIPTDAFLPLLWKFHCSSVVLNPYALSATLTRLLDGNTVRFQYKKSSYPRVAHHVVPHISIKKL